MLCFLVKTGFHPKLLGFLLQQQRFIVTQKRSSAKECLRQAGSSMKSWGMNPPPIPSILPEKTSFARQTATATLTQGTEDGPLLK
jgi:hypothetical protein